MLEPWKLESVLAFECTPQEYMPAINYKHITYPRVELYSNIERQLLGRVSPFDYEVLHITLCARMNRLTRKTDLGNMLTDLGGSKH